MTTRTQRDFRAVVTVIVKHEQVQAGLQPDCSPVCYLLKLQPRSSADLFPGYRPPRCQVNIYR